jgi:hypothetical protein
MNKIIKMLLAVTALGLAWIQPAMAGRRDVRQVAFLFLGNEGSVFGALGSARNDLLDANEYVRCESNFDMGTWSGSCSARKATTSITCTFPIFAQYEYQAILANITPDSLISFSWNTTTKVCDSLYVYADSFDEPKLP